MEELSLREIQLESLKVLEKIDEICKKESITYFVVLGSLIGAIRHNGFIPWDDDLDIAMPRDQYEKFINYCINNKDKLGNFKLLHYKTNKKYVYPIARFSNSNFIAVEEDVKPYGLGAFVDVYPLDGQNPQDMKHLKKINFYANFVANFCAYKYCRPAKNKFVFFFKKIVYWFMQFVSPKPFLRKLDKLGQKYSFYENERINIIIWQPGKMYYREDFDGVTYHQFENDIFPIPIGYDRYLKTIYGNYNELPPIEKRNGHHFYKLYRKEDFDENLCNY